MIYRGLFIKHQGLFIKLNIYTTHEISGYKVSKVRFYGEISTKKLFHTKKELWDLIITD